MSNAPKYWQFARLNSAGQRQVEEIAIAKTQIESLFPSLLDGTIAEVEVQTQLFEQWRDRHAANHTAAELCLRCFISNEIDRLCKDLGHRFGQRGGFTINELYPYVLDDVDWRIRYSDKPEQYRSIADQSLHTFDPDKAQLSTWIQRLVKSKLNAFLQDCGIRLETDWSILNGITPDLLQRLLNHYSNFSASKIAVSCQLLTAYHAVYRSDRRQFKRPGSRQKCLPPTDEQCDRIVAFLQTQGIAYDAATVTKALQALAACVRNSRNPATIAIDPLEMTFQKAESKLVDERHNAEAEDNTVNEFLTRYHEQLQVCLQAAMQQVIADRAAYYQRKKPPQDQNFLKALSLFYCESLSMSAIAPSIGLTKQYQVTRLLNLSSFRVDVQQKALQNLLERISKLAKDYMTLDRLTQLEAQIKTILEELIQEIMDEATAEASSANRESKSLFADILCQQLSDRRS